MRKSKYDLSNIQLDFNNGLSWLEVENKYGISHSQLGKYTKQKLLISNKNNKNQWRNGFKFSDETIEKIRKTSKGRRHTEETKQKISNARLDFLRKHPDKVPYLVNHSSKRSYPEIVFENALKSLNITGWKYHYQHSIYQYDFAFPKEKIDVEIDGGTHKTEKVKRIDKRRDIFSKENGWIVLRFEAELVKKDVMKCVNVLKKVLYFGNSVD